jgi:hypothetical protein
MQDIYQDVNGELEASVCSLLVAVRFLLIYFLKTSSPIATVGNLPECIFNMMIGKIGNA